MRQDTNINYLPFGGITGFTYGNGLTLTQGYDNQYRISSIVTGSILNMSFGYDPNGNIVSILDTVNPPGGELLETPGTYSYQQATNKLTHIEATPPIDYGYDANGNITSANNRTFIYDLSNQLIRVEDNGTTVAEYVYNGMGQRIKKNAQGSVRIFHYNQLGYLISETTEAGQIIVEYIYLGNKLLALIQGEQVYYYHCDHLGTPQVLTDDSGTVSWKATYTPFGQAQVVIETVTNPFRLVGQYSDQETGLHYNYFRYYDPKAGRYMIPDPIGLEGGINLFAYTENNPVNKIDRLGLNPCNSDCTQGWFDCLAKCIEAGDPANGVMKGVGTVLGGPIPKGVAARLGVRVITQPGSSPITNLPSITSELLNLGARNWLRTVGAGATYAWIGYGLWLFGWESHCAIRCSVNPCAF